MTVDQQLSNVFVWDNQRLYPLIKHQIEISMLISIMSMTLAKQLNFTRKKWRLDNIRLKADVI